MSDSSVIRSRYTRNEIISVMQEVATVMGSRKQKAHYLSGTTKIKLQISFLEEKVANLNEKIKNLNRNITKAEVTAKEPSETMLRLRSIKQTLTNEYSRFTEIAKQSRERVKSKNRESIELLSQEIQDLEDHVIPLAKSMLETAQLRNDDLQGVKRDHFSTLAKLYTDFVAVLHFATREMEQSSAKLAELAQKDQESCKFLSELSRQDLELSNEISVLDEAIMTKQKEKDTLEKEVENLLRTKKRIDSLEDPQAYIEEISLQLEEDKLSLEAKHDALKTVQSIHAEVKEVNANLEKGIHDYESILNEFELGLANI